jgi:hypothetical protein
MNTYKIAQSALRQRTSRVFLASFAFLLTASLCQAWPWTRAWVKQNMCNNCNAAVNEIMVNGVNLGAGCKAYTDPCAQNAFPQALLLVVPNPVAPGNLAGCAWKACNTVGGQCRKIGIGCFGCTAVAGASSWWNNGAFVCFGPPFGGVSCSSPVKLWGLPVDEPFIGFGPVGDGTITYENIEYALMSSVDEVDMDAPILATLVWTPVSPSSVSLSPGSFFQLSASLPDTLSDESVLLRGTVKWAGSPTNSAPFLVQLAPMPVPQGLPVSFVQSSSLGAFIPETNVVFNTDPDTGGSPYGSGRTLSIYTNYSRDGTNYGLKVRVFDFDTVVIGPGVQVTAQGSGPLILTSGGEITHLGTIDVSGASGESGMQANSGGGGGGGGGAVALFASGAIYIESSSQILALGGNGGSSLIFGGGGAGGVSIVGGGKGGSGGHLNGDGGNGGAGARVGNLFYTGAGGGGGGGAPYIGQGGQAGPGAWWGGQSASAGGGGANGTQCLLGANGGWGGAGGSTFWATPGNGGLGGINNANNTKGQNGQNGAGGGGWWGSAGGGGGGGGAAIAGNGGNGGSGISGGGGGGGGGGADACANATCAGCKQRGSPGAGGSGGGGGFALAAGFPSTWYGGLAATSETQPAGNGGAGGGGACALGSGIGQIMIDGMISLAGGDADGLPGSEGGMGVLFLYATSVTRNGSILAVQAQSPGQTPGDWLIFGGGGGGGGGSGVEQPILSVEMNSGIVVVTWTGQGILQAAPALTGNSWTNVLNATSPYPVAPTAQQLFYRVAVMPPEAAASSSP